MSAILCEHGFPKKIALFTDDCDLFHTAHDIACNQLIWNWNFLFTAHSHKLILRYVQTESRRSQDQSRWFCVGNYEMTEESSFAQVFHSSLFKLLYNKNKINFWYFLYADDKKKTKSVKRKKILLIWVTKSEVWSIIDNFWKIFTHTSNPWNKGVKNDANFEFDGIFGDTPNATKFISTDYCVSRIRFLFVYKEPYFKSISIQWYRFSANIKWHLPKFSLLVTKIWNQHNCFVV